MVTWNRPLLTTAGRAIRQPARRLIEIQLGTRMLDSEAKLWSTLAHEMRHAAVWLIDERVAIVLPERNHHGQRWRAWATAMVRCFPELPGVEVCHATPSPMVRPTIAVTPIAMDWPMAATPPQGLASLRCNHCRGPLVASEGMAPDRAPVSHIRRAPQVSPSVRAWHLFSKRHTDRCRQSPRPDWCCGTWASNPDVALPFGRVALADEDLSAGAYRGCGSTSEPMHPGSGRATRSRPHWFGLSSRREAAPLRRGVQEPATTCRTPPVSSPNSTIHEMFTLCHSGRVHTDARMDE